MQINNALNLIGNTPLIYLKNEDIFAKAEFLNPSGSIKDRVALAMIEYAESSGRLKKDSIIVEPTSGNTGIGLALVGMQKGYKVIIVMPENMSQERKLLIKSLGAELILTPADESINGSVQKVEEMAKNNDKIVVLNQFKNPDNPRIHYEETAHELWKQIDGDISCFVTGIGSGGTIQGVGKFLKERKKDVKIIAVEPKNVSALLGHEPGLHRIEGIGDGFVPDVLDVKLIDDVIEVTDDAAVDTTKQLCREQGLLVGISSGANVWAARKLREKIAGKIATVLPDRAERYFSTALLH